MKNNLAERLERILMIDKSVEPERILPALKSDIRDVIRAYAELGNDITLEIQESQNGYDMVLIASVKRFKM